MAGEGGPAGWTRREVTAAIGAGGLLAGCLGGGGGTPTPTAEPTATRTPTPTVEGDRYAVVISFGDEWVADVFAFREGEVVDSESVGGATGRRVEFAGEFDRIEIDFRPDADVENQTGSIEVRRNGATIREEPLVAEPKQVVVHLTETATQTPTERS